MKIVKEVKMVKEEKILLVLAHPAKRDPPLMRGGPSCMGGRVHSNKLTSPLAHMFFAVVTAMVSWNHCAEN